MGARLPDISTLIQAGIDPKTGLPIKMAEGKEGWRKSAIRTTLRVLDEQNAVNRYKWDGLPENITSQELERLLYYKGQLCFFYIKELDQYYFMPYALDGTIDFYGRFNTIHPVPMSNGTSDAEKAHYKRQADYLSKLRLDCLYAEPNEEVDKSTVCVLLHDYTKQLSQTIISRQVMQEPLLDIMADCIPFMRTALINSTGIAGMRVNTEAEQHNVFEANQAVDIAAQEGKKYIAVVGNVDFQEMTGGDTAKAEEFMQAMQSLDNFRLSLYGLDNGGLYQKKAHMLQDEQDANQSGASSAMEDGLQIRKRFCEIANAAFGTSLSVEIGANEMADEGIIEDGEDTSDVANGMVKENSDDRNSE